ncbi:MAG: PAS domain S-box protein [Bacteroidia bacterium]|nr:PAS domain S-box protein [Bacteroidia bacterium]
MMKSMAKQVREFNWSDTKLGDIKEWPQSLSGALNLINLSPAPLLILWGTDAIMIYNDPFSQIADTPEKECLGKKVTEAWPVSASFMENVLSRCNQGEGVSLKNLSHKINRNNKTTDVFLDLDFSPITGDNGQVAGIFCVVKDNTIQVQIEEELKKKEERIRFAIQASQDGIWDWDFKNDKAWWSERYSEILGVNIPFANRGLTSVNEFIHPEDRQKVPDALKAYLEEGKKFEVEYRNIRPTGEIRYILGKGQAVKDDLGNMTRLTGIISDITERKQAEEALKESEFRIQQIINSLPLVVWTASTDGNLTYISNQWEEFYGNLVSNSLGIGWTRYVHPDDIENAGMLWRQSLQNGTNYETEFRVQHKKGLYHWILVRALPIRDQNDKIIAWYGSNTDIQDKKLAEEALRESEVRFRTMAENISQLAWMTDETGWIFWYNERWFDYTGTTMKQMEDWGWERLHHPQYLKAVKDKFLKAIEIGEAWEDTFPLLGKDGKYRWFLSRAIPIKGKDDKVLRWFGTNTDITELMNTEQALIESEERFRTMAEGTDIYIAVEDESKNAVYFNKVWMELTGRPMAELVEFGWTDLIHDENREEFVSNYLNAFDKKCSFTGEFRIQNKEGQYRWMLAKGLPRFRPDNSFAGYISSCVDITDRIKSEEALKESLTKFKKLLEAVPQITWTNFPNGEVNFYNEQWHNYTGLNYDETKEWGWQKVIHPNDLKSTIKVYNEALQNGNVFVTENRYKRADGEFRWHLNRALPVRNEEGEITLWIGTATDIHEQKAIEEQLEKLVSERTIQLQQSNEDLQQFAHVASHDLKEPLRKIKIYTSRVYEEFAEILPPTAKEFINKIHAASNRMQVMIDGVLTYSSVNAIEKGIELIDLNSVIKNIESDLEILIIQKEATIKKGNLPSIEGASVLIYQLFYNLINNALKFSSLLEKPLISITSETVNESARILVRDNGIGFEPEYSKRIFETFVRLNSKDKYDGTGLGLALCKKITQRHGGTIIAESKKNSGADFIITLPFKQIKNK